MIMIVRRYFTGNWDLYASKELLSIVNKIAKTDRDTFASFLDQWRVKWETLIHERSCDKTTGKTSYTHKSQRSAFNSLRYYQPYLLTLEKYTQFHTPNTNAGIESLNSKLKTMLHCHSGISKFRRLKLIQEFIARHY